MHVLSYFVLLVSYLSSFRAIDCVEVKRSSPSCTNKLLISQEALPFEKGLSYVLA